MPSEPAPTAVKPPSERRVDPLPKWLVWTFLALVVAVVICVRVRLLDFPLERDEGEYAYAGQLIRQGIPPYELAYNMKMPGTYLAYAGLMTIFGETPAGIHLGLLVVNLSTLALLFLLALRYCSHSGAAAGTAAYALMAINPMHLGLAAHATHFVVLPALAGFLVLPLADTRGRAGRCLGAGCLFGVAFLMKQPGMFFGIFAGLYLIYLGVKTRPVAWANLMTRLLAFSAGCLLPFLVTCFWLAIGGVFGKFWFWTISYAREYATGVSLHIGWLAFQDTVEKFLGGEAALWGLAAVGLVCIFISKAAAAKRIFLSGFLIFSFLAVCPSLYFREHYFILLFPAVSLLIGQAVSIGEGWLGRTRDGAQARYLPFALALLADVQPLYANREVLFVLSPIAACETVYGNNPFPESLPIARYLEDHTTPDQKIAVFGSEPQIYFYAHRHSATGYIYTYPLMEPQPFASQMQTEMIEEIERNRPAYIVFVSMQYSWLKRPDSDRKILDWLVKERAAGHLEVAGLIDFMGSSQPQIVWGAEAARTPLRSSSFVAIFKTRTTLQSLNSSRTRNGLL